MQQPNLRSGIVLVSLSMGRKGLRATLSRNHEVLDRLMVHPLHRPRSHKPQTNPTYHFLASCVPSLSHEKEDLIRALRDERQRLGNPMSTFIFTAEEAVNEAVNYLNAQSAGSVLPHPGLPAAPVPGQVAALPSGLPPAAADHSQCRGDGGSQRSALPQDRRWAVAHWTPIRQRVFTASSTAKARPITGMEVWITTWSTAQITWLGNRLQRGLLLLLRVCLPVLLCCLEWCCQDCADFPISVKVRNPIAPMILPAGHPLAADAFPSLRLPADDDEDTAGTYLVIELSKTPKLQGPKQLCYATELKKG